MRSPVVPLAFVLLLAAFSLVVVDPAASQDTGGSPLAPVPTPMPETLTIQGEFDT